MIPEEATTNKKSNLDFRLVPFKDTLNLESPTIISKNNDNNIFIFPKEDKINNELYSYNEQNNTRSPSEMIQSLNLDISDDITCNKNSSPIDEIFSEIKKNSPGTLTLMEAYNIPSPVAKLIGRRFIKLTLDYEKKE